MFIFAECLCSYSVDLSWAGRCLMKGDVADEAVALFGGWRCNYPHLPDLAVAETM